MFWLKWKYFSLERSHCNTSWELLLGNLVSPTCSQSSVTPCSCHVSRRTPRSSLMAMEAAVSPGTIGVWDPDTTMLALRVKILLFQAYSSIMERKYFFIKKKQSGGQIFLLSALHWERESVDLGEKYLGRGWLLSVCVVLRTARVWCRWGPCELLWEFTVRNPHADLIPCLRDIQFFPCGSRDKLWKESSLYSPKKPQRTWCGIMPWYVPSPPS